MSLAQPSAQDRRLSPSLELATNNPFRARLSGAPLSPGFESKQPLQRERPQSRNPFLDVYDEEDKGSKIVDGDTRHRGHKSKSISSSSSTKPVISTSGSEIFVSWDSLYLHNESGSGQESSFPLINVSDEGSRHPSTAVSNRRPGPPVKSNSERPRDPRRRPRRNSDSSVIDAHETEIRERNFQKDKRSKDGKLKAENGSKSRRENSSDRRRKHSALDVIDKLDVTGIYGSGLFHHDGPFDACNPHRNKSSRRLAPVQAFPLDSKNNTMTGFGPLNDKADHSHIFGDRDAEAFGDYGKRPLANRAASFDPKAAIEIVHGTQSLGLGTSTFLDGAPASRLAIQKLELETADERKASAVDGGTQGGGLQRKKSLAQKIRAIKAGGPDMPSGSRRRPPPPPGGNRSPSGSGSPTTPSTDKDGNYFPELEDNSDNKIETVNGYDGDNRIPSSPRKPHPSMNRVGGDESSNSANGLLKRVRSLSKPKRRTEL